MKILCSLPESKHYRLLQSQVEGRYIWQDKASSLVRIIAPEPNPWGKQWLIMPSIQKAKNDTAQYPVRLDIKCLEMGNSESKSRPLIREIIRGKFVYPQAAVQIFFAFPLEGDERSVARNLGQWWLLYSAYSFNALDQSL